MMMDVLLAKYGICEGYVFVCDMQGSTFSHMAHINIFTMRKFMHYVQVYIYFLFVTILYMNFQIHSSLLLLMMTTGILTDTIARSSLYQCHIIHG